MGDDNSKYVGTGMKVVQSFVSNMQIFLLGFLNFHARFSLQEAFEIAKPLPYWVQFPKYSIFRVHAMLLNDRNDINKSNICCANPLLHECIPHNNAHWLMQVFIISSLNANFTEWLNTLKQFTGKKPTNCLSVFDDFVWLAHKWLVLLYKMTFPIITKEQILFYVCPFQYSYGFTHR